MRRLLTFALVVAALGCVPETPKYEIKLPDRHAKLDNGMRVILLPDPTTELVEVDVRYEVGSNEDPAGRAGLAHLVEHLMFDQRQAGPDKPPLGVILREHSLYNNAYTTYDKTHYQNLARKEELGTILGFEAARLATGCNTIDEDTFEREREVVRNEMRFRVGTPDSQALYRFLADFYPPDHPYARLEGGDDAQIAAITLPEICKFMQDYYVPERATVVISGNVNEAQAQAAIDTSLVSLQARKGAPRREVPPITIKHQTLTHEADVEESSVLVAWKLPPRFSAEDTAAQLGIFAAYGRAAFEGAQYDFASRVVPMLLGGPKAPMYGVQVYLRDASKVDEAVAAIYRGARESKRGWDGDKLEFEKLQTLLVGDVAAEFEQLEARADSFADFAQFDSSNTYFAGELARIRALTPDDIRHVMSNVLDPDKSMVIVIKAKQGAGGHYQRAKGAYAASQDHQDKLPVDKSEAAVPIAVPARSTILDRARRFELPNGMKVVLLPSQSSLPFVDAQLIFAAGTAAEPPDQAGLAELSARMLHAARNDEGQDPFQLVGIRADARAAADVSVFELHGLGLYLDVMVKGLERLITAGDYNQEVIEQLQRSRGLELKRKEERARFAFSRAFGAALYGPNHPYATTGVPSAESIGRIGRDAAYKFRGKHYSARNATLVIAGAFNDTLAENMIREAFSSWGGGDADPLITTPPPERTGPIYLGVEGDDTPLVTTRIAYPIGKAMDGDYAARLVLTEMINDRVAVVRDKLGASYGVYARLSRDMAASSYQVGGDVDALRAGEGLAAMRTGIDSLRSADNFLEDFVRARRKVLSDLVVDSNDSFSLSQRLSTMAIFHLTPDYYDKLIEQVAQLTPSKVIKLVNTELVPTHEIIGAMGPRAAVEKAFTDAKLPAPTFVEPPK